MSDPNDPAPAPVRTWVDNSPDIFENDRDWQDYLFLEAEAQAREAARREAAARKEKPQQT